MRTGSTMVALIKPYMTHNQTGFFSTAAADDDDTCALECGVLVSGVALIPSFSSSGYECEWETVIVVFVVVVVSVFITTGESWMGVVSSITLDCCEGEGEPQSHVEDTVVVEIVLRGRLNCRATESCFFGDAFRVVVKLGLSTKSLQSSK